MSDLEDSALMTFQTLTAMGPVLEANRIEGARKSKARLFCRFTGGRMIAKSTDEHHIDANRSSAPRNVKGHVGYKVDGRKTRVCKGPVIARNKYRALYALPELGSHKWHARKEKALKAGNGDIIWEHLHRKGKTTRNPWHTKHKVHQGGFMYVPHVQMRTGGKLGRRAKIGLGIAAAASVTAGAYAGRRGMKKRAARKRATAAKKDAAFTKDLWARSGAYTKRKQDTAQIRKVARASGKRRGGKIKRKKRKATIKLDNDGKPYDPLSQKNLMKYYS